LRASRAILRNASIAALAAVLLNAFWPLLAAARPADSLLAPVCSTGATHYIKIERGDTPLEQRSSTQHDHCKLCVFAGDRLAPPAADLPLLRVAEAPVAIPPRSSAALFTSRPAHPARPRAPPVVS